MENFEEKRGILMHSIVDSLMEKCTYIEPCLIIRTDFASINGLTQKIYQK